MTMTMMRALHLDTARQEGTPLSALLAQGGPDTRLSVAGGLGETGRASHASNRLTAWRYTHAGLSVVEVLDPNIPHDWPGWDIMALMVEFFERS